MKIKCFLYDDPTELVHFHILFIDFIALLSLSGFLFPTCQVRVVRVYVGLLLPSFLLLLPPSSQSLSSWTASLTSLVCAARPQPGTPACSVPSCRTSTVIFRGQCSLPDVNRDLPRQAFPARPQPRSSGASVPCRTSTATICAQRSLPGLNRELECQTECGKIWQTECQKECQIGCLTICQKVCQKICRTECQKMSQTECQKESQNECQKECQKECETECQKIRQKECRKICQKECQKICWQKECHKIYVRKNVRWYVTRYVSQNVRRCEKECQKISRSQYVSMCRLARPFQG